MSYSPGFVAITLTQVSFAITAVSLALALTENRRRHRAEQREERAEERAEKAERRAERAERREEERHAREVEEAESSRRAVLVGDVRRVSVEREHFLVSMYVRNVGAVPARKVSLVLADESGRQLSERQQITGDLDPRASPRNVVITGRPLPIPARIDVLGSWTDDAGRHVDEPLGS